MQGIKSKKRKNTELSKPTDPIEEVQQELKKVKQNDIELSNDSNEVKKVAQKNTEVLSLENLLKESENVYCKMIKNLEEKEKEQDVIIKQIYTDLDNQKQEDVTFLKYVRGIASFLKGDEKIEKLVEDLENENQDLKEKVKNQEKLNREIEEIQKTNEELKSLLEKNMKHEEKDREEVYKEVGKIESELKAKNNKVKELQSIVELYYSLTNLKINTDQSSQDPPSDFYCNIRSESRENELEFKLKDTEDNEIEYNPIKCKVTKGELENHPFLQEEITFDLGNLKKFFKTIFEVVNKN